MTEAPKKHHFVMWIAVLVIGIIIIAAAGFYLVNSSKKQAPADVMEEDGTADVMDLAPDEGLSDNPFADVETNPVAEDADNPFDDADYNPFN